MVFSASSTSWIELIEARWNVLVDADAQKIEDAAFYHEPSMSGFSELYGSGDAGEKIVEIICTQLF